MFKFGKRRVNKQGGSYLISLPIAWVKSVGVNLSTVEVEMDSEQTLRIVAGDICQDITPGHNTLHQKGEANV